MIAIRRVEPGDSAHVKALIEGILNTEFPEESKAFDYPDLNDPAAYYAGKRDVFYVAQRDGQIVGTVAVKEDDRNTALLRRVFVRKEFRNKGYGKKLLAKALQFCEEHHYRQVMFHGTDRMETALQLCLKNGFEEEDITLSSDLKMVLLRKTLLRAPAEPVATHRP
ncbi:MAG: GNAT family N-acetyltransferase [Kiritimatiellae bacterium]|nr:GNAT family N-acetyltransferase [Kiritimatiellia bacterium]